jgi:hypothetical protein
MTQLLQLLIVTPVCGVIFLYLCIQTCIRVSPFIIRFEHLNIANSKSIEFLFKRVKQKHRISTPQRPHSARASSHSTTISILQGEPFPAMHLSRSPPHRSPPATRSHPCKPSAPQEKRPPFPPSCFLLLKYHSNPSKTRLLASNTPSHYSLKSIYLRQPNSSQSHPSQIIQFDSQRGNYSQGPEVCPCPPCSDPLT